MARLENTVVMITGGAQGIGEGIARRLASEGAAIAIADLNGDKAKAVAETFEGRRGRAGAISRAGWMWGIAARSKAAIPRRSWTASAGSTSCSTTLASTSQLRFFEVDEANFNSILRVNASGRHARDPGGGAKQMIAQGGGGKIIKNTASIAGRQGYAEFAPYCCSKSAVISLTQAGAREFAKHKITVNAFAPGVVVTPLWDGLEQDMIDKGVIKKKGEFIESFWPASCSATRQSPRTSRGSQPFSRRATPTISPDRSSCRTAAWCWSDRRRG